MKLFKKKAPPKTIQEIQQEIMNVQFEVLKKFLEMNALKFKMREMEVDTNELIHNWETLTKVMDQNKQKIKDEIDETIAKNTKSDSALI